MSMDHEKVYCQSGAWDHRNGTPADRWWQRHLIGPVELQRLINDSATLGRIRAHFQHGADEEAWPPGTEIDVVVGQLVLERNQLRSAIADAHPKPLP